MAGATSPSTGSHAAEAAQPERRASPAASPRCAPRSAATGSARMGDDALARVGAAGARQTRARRCAACCAASPSTSAATPRRRARQLEDGARRAAVPAPQVQALCLTQLALIALEDDDPEGAARLITRARSQIAPPRARALSDERARPGRLGARARAARTRRGGARRRGRGRASCSSGSTDVAPWYELEVRIVLARAALRLSDVNEARTQLAAAARLARPAAGGGHAAAAGCAPPKPTSRRSRARPARCRRR